MNIIKGDLVEMAKVGDFDVIVHGCNCYHSMTGGIARQLKETFPEISKSDEKTTYGDISKLGSFSSTIITLDSGKLLNIINAYTQYMPGRDVRYGAILESFIKINIAFPDKKIGIPKIGCGIAGGEWDIVEQIIDIPMKNKNLTVVEYDK